MISIPHEALGTPNQCPACGDKLSLRLTLPLGDTTCPHCSHPLWYIALNSATRFFRPSDAVLMQGRLSEIVAQQLGVSPADVRADWTSLSELGADSLEVVEILMVLEEQFEDALESQGMRA